MLNLEQVIAGINSALKRAGFKSTSITTLHDHVMVMFDEFGMNINIYPSQKNPPGRKVNSNNTEFYKSFDVTYHAPQLPTEFPPIALPPDLKAKGHYSLHVKENERIRFSFKMNEDLKDYLHLHTQLKAIQEKFGAEAKSELAKKEEAAQKFKKKMEIRRQERESRFLTYENLMASLNSGFPGRIESSMEGEFVNLTLNNQIKIKLQAEPKGVFVVDMELDKELNPFQISRFLQKLASTEF